MLKKKYRLPAQNFRAHYEEQKRGEFLTIRVKKNSLPFSRFGVIISKKIAAKATKRNELKRGVYNFIQKKKINNLPGRDVIIVFNRHPTSGKADGWLFALSKLLS